MMFFIVVLCLVSIIAADEYPQDITEVNVLCSGTFEVDLDDANEQDVALADTIFDCQIQEDDNVKLADIQERIKTFISQVEATGEIDGFHVESDLGQDYYEIYSGSELYTPARNFFGFTEDDEGFNLEKFLEISYFLEYYANNTFAVALPPEDEQEPVVGFAGGVFASDGYHYDDSFMDALRNVAVQYNVNVDYTINEKQNGTTTTSYVKGKYILGGYLGTFSLPYFVQGVQEDSENKYFTPFATGYNAEYSWATKDAGNFLDYTNLFSQGQSGVIPPGVFMANFAGIGNTDTNTFDTYGELNAKGEWPTFSGEPTSPIGYDRFKYMFALHYGIRNYANNQFTTNALAYNSSDIDEDEHYDSVEGKSMNFCRNLSGNNRSDVKVEDNSGYSYNSYNYVDAEEENQIICNQKNLPSVFFMTYTFSEEELYEEDGETSTYIAERPIFWSTKHQLIVDGSCQFRTNLDTDGNPMTSTTNVEFGYNYDNHPYGKPLNNDDLPEKTTFIMNGNDFFGIHMAQKQDENGHPVSTSYDTSADSTVPYSYSSYELRDDTISNVYIDKHSLCNTGISDNYVLYDMKQYANLYNSIAGISSGSFDYETVYSSMKTYPVKSNYTAFVSAANKNGEYKTQIQKCVNVFLDTSGEDISACNDVTSTWSWGVFGGSMVGIIIVVVLWVWGTKYNNAFNNNLPEEYKLLERYEPEWKRLQEVEKTNKNKAKLNNKGKGQGVNDDNVDVDDNTDEDEYDN